MRTLDLILENIRDEYMINILEEGTVSELESLKTKKFLNESIQSVRGILVQEGVMDSVRDHLADNWKKYAVGAGTATLMGQPEAQDAVRDIVGQGQEYMANYDGDNPIRTGLGVIGGGIAQAGERAANSIVDSGIEAGQGVVNAAQAVPGQVQDAYQKGIEAAQAVPGQLQTAYQNAVK